MARKTKGRQMLEIKKIESESPTRVTFSKRKSGILKKASELCTLCNVQLALIVFSHNPGKVFTLGHPDLETVIDKFLINDNQPDSRPNQALKDLQDVRTRSINMELSALQRNVEAEKTMSNELDIMRAQRQQRNWWEVPISELGLDQVFSLKIGMEELKKRVGMQAEKLVRMQQRLALGLGEQDFP